MDSDADEVFAHSLRGRREQLGLSQAQMADLLSDFGLNFFATTIYKIEGGKRKVTVAEAVAISKALKVDLLTMLREASPLDMASAAHVRRRSDLVNASVRLAEQMVQMALIADEHGEQLTGAQRDWMGDSFLKQTPGALAAVEAFNGAEADLTRRQVVVRGGHLARLMLVLGADIPRLASELES